MIHFIVLLPKKLVVDFLGSLNVSWRALTEKICIVPWTQVIMTCKSNTFHLREKMSKSKGWHFCIFPCTHWMKKQRLIDVNSTNCMVKLDVDWSKSETWYSLYMQRYQVENVHYNGNIV